MSFFSKRKIQPEERSHVNPLRYVTSFAKALTFLWMIVWVEVVLFSEIATVFYLGDTASIQYINDNVKELGVIVMAFYMSSKTIENCAQGVEEWKLKMRNKDDCAEEEPE